MAELRPEARRAGARTPFARRPLVGLISLGLGAGLVLGLSGCAPELGAVPNPDSVAGAKGKDSESGTDKGGDGSSWQTPNPQDVDKKQKELPASFPSEAFPLPAGAVIDDAGERGEGVWFVVLRAADASAAQQLWDAVASAGGFTLGDEIETSEGGKSASLSSGALVGEALTLPQSDGSVLLSYDLRRAA